MPDVDGNLQIERVNVCDVYACKAFRPNPATDEVNVIPKYRALAWSRNPHAASDVPALFVTRRGGKAIGYLGMFPVLLAAGAKREKVLSLSTWYVAPEHRGTGAGALLLTRTMVLKENLFALAPTPDAEWVYRAIRFKPFDPVRFAMLYLDVLNICSLPLDVLKRRAARHRAPMARLDMLNRVARKILYPCLKGFAYRFILAPLRDSLDGFSVDETDSVDETLLGAIPSQNDAKSTLLRDREPIDWMLTYPWTSEEASEATPNYEFSDVRPVFRYIVVRIALSDSVGQRAAMLLFVSVRQDGETALKVLDYELGTLGCEVVMAVVLKYAKDFERELALSIAIGSGSNRQ